MNKRQQKKELKQWMNKRDYRWIDNHNARNCSPSVYFFTFTETLSTSGREFNRDECLGKDLNSFCSLAVYCFLTLSEREKFIAEWEARDKKDVEERKALEASFASWSSHQHIVPVKLK